MSSSKVQCPICSKLVYAIGINDHIDSSCSGSSKETAQERSSSPDVQILPQSTPTATKAQEPAKPLASIFSAKKRDKSPVKAEETALRPAAPPSRKVLGKRPSNAGAEVKNEPGLDSAGARAEKKARINPLTANQPLAERSRPTTLEMYIGQDDLVGPESLLRARMESGQGAGSLILWGPPGSGKTTLARLIARMTNADFKELSATSAGTADVRQVFEQAKNGLTLTGRRTILMVDEIHRFTKPQQDLFLPYVENGWVQLIGATTENPSFKVNGALLSRCQVFTLTPHTPASLAKILKNALANLPGPPPPLPPDLIPFLADVADGDARQALNSLELSLEVCKQTRLDGDTTQRDKTLMEAVRKGLRKGYDRSGEERYDMISAMHKSCRGSDGSAAMYWLARMITGGEDALYIARRLVVMASEDIGLADPHALPLAMATYQACQVIGLPECRINLAHCVAYLAEAPKSTRAYTAYGRAAALAHETPLPGVPLQIRNAPTKLMKQLGYGKEYSYDPNFRHPVYNEYLPPELAERSSLSSSKTEHILQLPEVYEDSKSWDEDRLKNWEGHVNQGKRWQGRSG